MTRSRQAGFTLIEMMAAFVVTLGILHVISITLNTSKTAYETTSARFDVTENVRRVLRRISDELHSASRFGER